MIKLLVAFLLSTFVFQEARSQCTLAIRQTGLTSDTVPGLILGDDEAQVPERLNDSTIEFKVPPTRTECLFIIIDRKTHWFTRVWIDSTVLHKELIINYSKRTATIKDGNETDRVLEKVLSLNLKTQKKQNDSIQESYIRSNPDKYFSLWLLSHGLNKEAPKKNLVLLDNLSPELKKHTVYRQMKANLTERRYPGYGDTFKEFALNDIKEHAFNSTAIKNKIIVLHFWSNGCGPCVKGMDAMVDFYKTLDTSNIAFISVSLDTDKSSWKRSATTHKIIWTNLWTEDNVYCDLCLNYNLRAMPYFIVFSRSKKMTFFNEGEDLELLKNKLSEADK